LTESGK